jgi:uncharacterized protein (TIRG00374 family)
MLRLVLLFFGLVTFVTLLWHIGPTRIAATLGELPPAALFVILLPSIAVYLLNALGWRFALDSVVRKPPFLRLFTVQMAGEAINITTPTGYVGGEPIKAYMLTRHQVPLAQAGASVVTAKTCMTIAQVLFILIGIGLSIWRLPSADSAKTSPSATALIVGTSISLGLLLCGITTFVAVQRAGMFSLLLAILGRCRIRIRSLEVRAEQLKALDRTILAFYTEHRHALLLSTGTYLLGWLTEAAEVYAILYYVSGPVDWGRAIAIGAFAALIKGGTFFIPGSLGAQEAGNIFMLNAFGYSELDGIAFALLRRYREFVWIAVGLACLATLESKPPIHGNGEG